MCFDDLRVDGKCYVQEYALPVKLELVKRAENVFDMELIWKLMSSEVFSQKNDHRRHKKPNPGNKF